MRVEKGLKEQFHGFMVFNLFFLCVQFFRVVSPSLKKTSGQSFCAFREFENKIALVFLKLILSLLDMYQQVIFSNSLFIVSARVIPVYSC